MVQSNLGRQISRSNGPNSTTPKKIFKKNEKFGTIKSGPFDQPIERSDSIVLPTIVCTTAWDPDA